MALFQSIVQGEVPYRALFTSNFVIDETVTRVLYEAGHRHAATVLGLLRADPTLKVLHVSVADEPDIDKEFLRYSDSKISYTDCSTKVLMDRNGIDTIFSFDEDFETMGITRVP